MTESVDSTTESVDSTTESGDSATESGDSATESGDSVTESVDSTTESVDSMTESVDSMTESVDSMTESSASATESVNKMAKSTGLVSIARPFLAGWMAGKGKQSRAGRKQAPSDPAGTDSARWIGFPAFKGWAVFNGKGIQADSKRGKKVGQTREMSVVCNEEALQAITVLDGNSFLILTS